MASNTSDIKPLSIGCASRDDTPWRRLTSVEELQHVNITEWDKLSQWHIDRVISGWHRRMEYVVEQVHQQGRQIETLSVNETVKNIQCAVKFSVLETVQHYCYFKRDIMHAL